MSSDKIQCVGTVVSQSHDVFSVKLDSGQMVNAKVSGKIRTNNIRIYLGDKVNVDISVLNTGIGIIKTRLSGK